MSTITALQPLIAVAAMPRIVCSIDVPPGAPPEAYRKFLPARVHVVYVLVDRAGQTLYVDGGASIGRAAV